MLWHHHSEKTIRILLERLRQGWKGRLHWVRLSEEMYWRLLEYDAEMKRQGCSTDTRYTRLLRLALFFSFLQERGKTLETVEWEDVKGYLTKVSYEQSSWGYRTIAIALKSYLHFLAESSDSEFLREKYEALWRKIKIPKVKTTLPRVLSEEEVCEIVFNYIQDPKFKLFFALAYETAARKAELMSIRLGDVELGDPVSYVTIRSSKSEPASSQYYCSTLS